MSSLPGYMPYDVRETEQFADDWRRAVRLGYLDPMVHPAALLQIKISLAVDPYISRLSLVKLSASGGFGSPNRRTVVWDNRR